MIAVRLRSLLNYAIIASVAAFAVVVVANLFLGDKKIDAKLEHRYPVASPQFERVMGAMLGPALLAGNRAEALVNGDRIFPAMLEAIRAARKTITFEMYIYSEGKVGEEFTAAFEERARRGQNPFPLRRARQREDRPELPRAPAQGRGGNRNV